MLKSRSVDKFESLIVIEVLLVSSSVERLFSKLSGRGLISTLRPLGRNLAVPNSLCSGTRDIRDGVQINRAVGGTDEAAPPKWCGGSTFMCRRPRILSEVWVEW